MEQKSEVEAKLIDAVRDLPELYLKSSPWYKDKTRKSSAWKDVASQLEMTVSEAQKMWNTLKSQYLKWVKKIKSPSGSAAINKPFFRHQESMRFLKDTVDPEERTMTNLTHDQGEEDDTEPETSDGGTFTEKEVQEASSNCNKNKNLDLVKRSKEQPPNRSHSQYNGKRKLDKFDSELLEILRNEDDEFDAYSKLLAKKFQSIGTADKKEFITLQQKISSLVMDSELSVLVSD